MATRKRPRKEEGEKENVVVNIDDDEDDVEVLAELASAAKQRKMVAADKKKIAKTSTRDTRQKGRQHFRTIRRTERDQEENESGQVDAENDEIQNDFSWTCISSLASQFRISPSTCQTLCSLLDEGNSVPFIARYRQQRQQLEPCVIRAFEEKYDELKKVRQKVKRLEASARRQSKPLSNRMLRKMYEAQTMEDLEAINEYLKVPKTRKIVVPKEIQVEAEHVLKGGIKSEPNESDASDITESVVAVLVDVMSKSEVTLAFLLDIEKSIQWSLYCCQVTKRKSSKTEKKVEEEHKFQDYFDFSSRVEWLKPHQVLAINRGVKLKILTSKLEPRCERLKNDFRKFCFENYFEHNKEGNPSEEQERLGVFQRAVDTTFQKFALPFLQRKKRSELNRLAEVGSIDVFCSNLRRMLLKRPQRNTCVLAIDPGYRHGCKLAVVSASGAVKFTGVIYPSFKMPRPINETDLAVLIEQVRKHKVDVFALGDGVGCRDAEHLLTWLQSIEAFAPLRIKYTIVSEVGASVYSCSDEAKAEFPNLKPYELGAISIARRLQDPLLELVKIDPKTLGVGMYQHDLSQSKINKALKDVLVECVSFVGVDLNKASSSVLTHVAGVGPKMAEAIVKYRESHGPFESRETLKNIKGLGKLTFRQCAGFVRIFNQKCKFDALQVHPEHYELARAVIRTLEMKESDIGLERMRTVCSEVAKDESFVIALAEKFKVDHSQIIQIIEALSQEMHSDLRDDHGDNVALFKDGLKSASELKEGEDVSGIVENVTHFGAFVNVGVEFSGLVHNSKMNGVPLQLGQRVCVRVNGVDVQRKRIVLQLVNVINQK